MEFLINLFALYGEKLKAKSHSIRAGLSLFYLLKKKQPISNK